jgi:glycosyltransferase involved in cell wall biosynthesis
MAARPAAVSVIAREGNEWAARHRKPHPGPWHDGRVRIVHLVTRSHVRGAEVVALELAHELDTLGHRDDVLAIARGADGGTVGGLPALVDTARLGARAYVQGGWRLRRRLASAPADVVVAHGGSAAILVAFALPGKASARVWQRILGLPTQTWGPIRRRFWRAVSRRFDAVVALTRALETEARGIGFDGPVWVIPNARNPARFAAVDRAAASARIRTEIGIGADVPLLGFVGHLVDQKHPELAVDVLAEVRRRGQPAHLAIAGDGPRRPQVEQRIVDRDLAGAVTLLGHRDDPEEVFGAVDLALITSRAEGIPGVAIEAAMTGCPVVTVAVGAVDEVVEDGVTGVVLPEASATAMAEAVVRLLADADLRHSMGAAARAGSAAFTWATTAPMYAKGFAGLVETGRGLRPVAIDG